MVMALPAPRGNLPTGVALAPERFTLVTGRGSMQSRSLALPHLS